MWGCDMIVNNTLLLFQVYRQGDDVGGDVSFGPNLAFQERQRLYLPEDIVSIMRESEGDLARSRPPED